jgi:GT2 family glycosyltransferase
VSQQSAKVAVVVLHYGDLRDTYNCLNSLSRLKGNCFQVIVVDNGTVPAAAGEIAKNYPHTHVIRREANGGWAGGNNTGIRYALRHGAEHVVLLNNDTTVAANLLEELLRIARESPDYGVLGPVISFMDEPDKVRTDGFTFNRPDLGGLIQRKEVALNSGDPTVITEVDIVNGCCMMVDAHVFRVVGLIDERFFLVHEESDLCLRARAVGFRCGVIGKPLVWHKGSRAFAASPNNLQRYYDARNLYLLLRKHSAASQNGRGPWRSRLDYLKSVYYRYCIEREQGQDSSAQSVLEGIWDAAAGHYGPYIQRNRPGIAFIKSIFEWRRQRGSFKVKETAANALLIR